MPTLDIETKGSGLPISKQKLRTLILLLTVISVAIPFPPFLSKSNKKIHSTGFSCTPDPSVKLNLKSDRVNLVAPA